MPNLLALPHHRQLQILQLIPDPISDAIDTGHDNRSGQAKGRLMYILTIHTISDPQAFWSGQLDLPEGTELPMVVPSENGARGVCLFKSNSVETVRNVVDGATSAVSRNEFYAINEGGALGLPAE